MDETAASGTLPLMLAHALRTSAPLDTPSGLVPQDRNDAYAVQHQIIERLGSGIAAWKVGTGPEPGTVLGSPLPALMLYRSPTMVNLADFSVCGIELEIAFRFSRPFPARGRPYDENEVMDRIDAMAAAIEIVSSRYRDWPDVPDALKLADLQNHGALILASPLPYQPDFDFLSPRATLTFQGRDIGKQPPANPAGDPRRLLTPFVNQAVLRPRAIEEGDWITTGSYSGIHFAQAAGLAVGRFEGLPPVELRLE
jgi:2-keto-4-pentenoate hydratase